MNNITNTLPAGIDNFLMNVAQSIGCFDYTDISNFGEKCTKKDIKKIKDIKEEIEELWEYGVEEDDEDLQNLCEELTNIIKGGN